MITDTRTGLTIADPDRPVVPADYTPEGGFTRAVDAAVGRMILSASGWRTIFAADGSPESTTPDVPAELLAAVGIAAECFATSLAAAARPRIVVGTDTRPTGAIIARAAIRALLAIGAEVEYVFVAATPEIMAYAMEPGFDGFFYVSASHNPIGHNGLKMGGADGGVIGGDTASALIARFREATTDEESVARVVDLLRSPTEAAERDCLASVSAAKERALAAYRSFSDRVVRGSGPAAATAYDAFRAAVAAAGPGVLGDLNGSARAASIDRDYLETTGCLVQLFNDKPGRIAHQIVPEGEGLVPCREELERLAAAGEPFILGYVPDNDGDRGNLVFYDESESRARQLEAQEVFALSCVAELSWIVATGELACDDSGRPRHRAAVVVNGPTSMRIDRIAGFFGVEVHRSEVGEANVVSLARKLREEGVIVRILGEGSNGGNITHPSSVRDPLHTLHAVLKLLYAPPTESGDAPARIWFARRYGVADSPAVTPMTLTTLLASLPRFTTTSAFEERAIMRIRTESHAALKAAFELLLPEAAATLIERLPTELHVIDYEVVNYEGTVVRAGTGNRTGAHRGGLKISFTDAEGTARAFAWMRGSGTEPVFRIMADVEGERPQVESMILDWLRELVQAADSSTPSFSGA